MPTAAPAAAQPTTGPATTSMGHARALLAMTRPSQIALIGVVFANGVLLGLLTLAGDPASLGPVLVALILVVLSSAAVHLANEAADHETDRLTERTPFSGGSGAIKASGMSHRAPLRLGLSLALISALGTLATVVVELLTPAAATLLLVGLLGGLAYSLPPLAAMRRGWGEALNALLGALLLPLFGAAVVIGSIGLRDALAFLPFFFVALASVMATAWPDRAADAATGKATMQVRLQPSTLRRIHMAASGAFVVATILSAAVGAMPLALAGLLVLPALAIGTARYTRSESPVPNVVAMVALALITTATLSATLLAGEGTR
jgi:1,4-dihydroxy-2-naphthoate octaprenyltransferase